VVAKIHEDKNAGFPAQIPLKFTIFNTMHEAELFQEQINKSRLYNITTMDADVKDAITTQITPTKVVFDTFKPIAVNKLCRLEMLFAPGDGISTIANVTKARIIEDSGKRVNRIEAEFAHLKDLDTKRIHKWQGIHKDLGINASRRLHKRIKITKGRIKYRKKAFLKWSEWGSWKIAKILNISSGGVLFRPKEKFKLNEVLSVQISVDSNSNTINALGKVVRIKIFPLEKFNEVAVVLSDIDEINKKRWTLLCKKISAQSKEENIFWF